jgi:hypothetical protein
MPDEGVAKIDAFVAGGTHPTRASFIVEAINRLVDELEQQRIDRSIIEGYTRIPPTPEETRWAELSGIDSIREEPW